MRKISFIHIIPAICLTALLYSCSTPRHFQRETVSTHGLYGALKTDSMNMADRSWDELFTDPTLLEYIQEGLSNNPDLQIAIQKVKEAEAYLAQSKASLLPGINASGTGAYARNSEDIYPGGPREVDSYQLALEASWEVDIWGKLRSSKQAAYANLLATDAGKKTVQTRLISNIAATYYNLMALNARMEITRQTVKNNIDLVETMKVLKESGKVTGAAIVQSEAARYAAEVTLPDLEQQMNETNNTLCLLLGRTPIKLKHGSLSEQNFGDLLQIGVPAQLLDNRPDVMQAEYSVISAFEITNNARAYFYPSLTLSASAGFAAYDLDQLLDPTSFAATIVGGLASPLFNKRGNVTRLRVAKAQQEEALLSLRNALLNAGQEVNNALGNYRAAEQKSELRALQLEALEKSVEYSRELLTYGSATYTEVLNAQQSLLAAKLSKINDQLQQLNAVVSLYRALGGGWK